MIQNSELVNLLSILLTVSLAMTQCLIKSNLRKEGSILAHNSMVRSIMVAKSSQLEQEVADCAPAPLSPPVHSVQAAELTRDRPPQSAETRRSLTDLSRVWTLFVVRHKKERKPRMCLIE